MYLKLFLNLSDYHKSAVRPVVSNRTTVRPADFLYARTIGEITFSEGINNMITKKITKYSLIAVFALIIQLSTVSFPKTVFQEEDIVAIKLGYPISFITQDFSRFGPPSFPQKYVFGSPWEYPTKVVWPNFLLSYLVIFFAIWIVFPFMEKLFIKTQKK